MPLILFDLLSNFFWMSEHRSFSKFWIWSLLSTNPSPTTACPPPQPNTGPENPGRRATASPCPWCRAFRWWRSGTAPSTDFRSSTVVRLRSSRWPWCPKTRRRPANTPSIKTPHFPRPPLLTLGPYCFRVTTSGAIQYGVPTMVVRFDCSGLIWAQKPKSAASREWIEWCAGGAGEGAAYSVWRNRRVLGGCCPIWCPCGWLGSSGGSRAPGEPPDTRPQFALRPCTSPLQRQSVNPLVNIPSQPRAPETATSVSLSENLYPSHIHTINVK